MPANHDGSRRTSAPLPATWPQICAACQDVINRAIDIGDNVTLRTYASASSDTLSRMLASNRHGGWTGWRIQGLRDYEERHLETSTIAEAQVGRPSHQIGSVEHDADRTLPELLKVATDLTSMRPKGYSRPECRHLVEELPTLIADLKRLERDVRDRLKGGR